MKISIPKPTPPPPSAPPGAAPAEASLDYPLEHQRMTNWCWAAVSSAVACYYGPSTPWTQGKIADAELGRKDCAVTPPAAPCNLEHGLVAALTRVDHFEKIEAVHPDFEVVRAEIDAERPLSLRIAWQGGGAHFATITGYDTSGEYLYVSDSLYETTHVPYDGFPALYHELVGNWSHTYWTRA